MPGRNACLSPAVRRTRVSFVLPLEFLDPIFGAREARGDCSRKGKSKTEEHAISHAPMSEGDAERQMETLYLKYAPDLLAYALRRGVGRSDAEDLVVETFAVCWRRLPEVPGPGLPWLLAVERRLLANQRRSSRRRVALEKRLEETYVQEHLSSDPDPPGDQAARESLLAALASLEERDRELLMLISWEGLSLEEAASLFGCSRPTVTKRLAQAREKLALQLGRSRT